jgi:hypothetical protein
VQDVIYKDIVVFIMATDYHEKQYRERGKKNEWAVMTPAYDSLKEDIMKYKEQRYMLSYTQTLLEHVYDDITRKKISIQRLALQTIVKGFLKNKKTESWQAT